MNSTPNPVCLIIAGPNGAGKTTFAKEFLPREGSILDFVNADLIAAGISPLRPEAAAIDAGRLLLRTIDKLVAARKSFAFESTLSGRAFENRLKELKTCGYRLEIIYLKLNSVELALKRIASRVREGGHNIPAAVARRRFRRSLINFEGCYQSLADAWWLYDASVRPPKLLSKGP